MSDNERATSQAAYKKLIDDTQLQTCCRTFHCKNSAIRLSLAAQLSSDSRDLDDDLLSPQRINADARGFVVMMAPSAVLESVPLSSNFYFTAAHDSKIIRCKCTIGCPLQAEEDGYCDFCGPTSSCPHACTVV